MRNGQVLYNFFFNYSVRLKIKLILCWQEYIYSSLVCLPDLEWFSQPQGSLGVLGWTDIQFDKAARLLQLSNTFTGLNFRPSCLPDHKLSRIIGFTKYLLGFSPVRAKQQSGKRWSYRVCIPFPSAACTDPDVAATSRASTAPSKGSHGNYIADKV